MAKLHMLQFGFFETGIVEYPMNGSPKQVVIRPAISRFIVPREELATTVMEILKLSGIERRMEELVEEVGECLELDKELGRISSIISRTPSRVLANYLILKYVEYSYFYYAPEVKTDADHCLEVVTAILPRASLRVFVRNHFKRENIRVASEMVEEVKEAFIEMIRNSTWLHVATGDQGGRYPKSSENEESSWVHEGIRERRNPRWDLDVSPEDSFFTLMTKINRFKTEQLMDYVTSDSLLNPIDSLVVANAYYYFTKNSLNVLIPFLDKPLFDFKYPRYVTMAGVGRVIAHEIGHAFDTIGRQTDEIGKVRDWWSPEDSKEYDHRVECFAGQFEDFVEKNATDVLPEIIADALGIEATWIAFKKLDLSNEETLIEFGHHDFKKLFFEIAGLVRRDYKNYKNYNVFPGFLFSKRSASVPVEPPSQSIPEHIQLMTTNQSREESDQNRPSAEEAENTERITVSRKRFIATVVLLVAIIVGLLVALLVGMWFSSKGEAQKMETCWTRECLGMASMLQNYRNPSVDPCDDFYEHTCGLLYEHSDDDVASTYKQYRRLLHQVQCM
uniref:Peptidase_M13 domain-containing protein n=1 Tax=Caenorhabditis tropicalis TaxID=1561998 RepID=A0A1I7UKW3_9PELO